jgi:hypothetical protein
MENIKLTFLFLLLAMMVIIKGDNYFADLNIDPNLLNQANLAMTDLKNTLEQNLNCQPQNNGLLPGLNLVGLSFLQQIFQHYPLKGLCGLQGYDATYPKFTWKQTGQNSLIFSTIYKQVITVSEVLQKVRNYLIQYNNIIIGNNNTVSGNNDIIIGSKNNLKGDNDWVFASDYQSNDPQNGVLIIGIYLIELYDTLQITYSPLKVIHCIQQSKSN